MFLVLNSPGTLLLVIHPFIILPSNFQTSTFETTIMLNCLHFLSEWCGFRHLILLPIFFSLSGMALYLLLLKYQESEVDTQSCPTLCDPMDGSPPWALSVEFSRQEYWSGLPFPSPGDLSDPRMEPETLAYAALGGGFFAGDRTAL